MKKNKINASKFITKCLECNKEINVYYIAPDFGDPPILLKCIVCGELFYYSKDDEYYIRPLSEQLVGEKCPNCKNSLINNLSPTHKNIDCCGHRFSLDDNFAGNQYKETYNIEAYNLY